MASTLAEIARRRQRIHVECCNPDCGRRDWFGPEVVARWAEAHPDMTILDFRIRARCRGRGLRPGCGARVGVRVQSPTTRGKHARRPDWKDDPTVWTRTGL